MVGRTPESRAAFEGALNLSVRIGNDSRASIICGNLSMLESSTGRFEAGMAYGHRALAYAGAGVNQPLRTLVYVALMENCALLGRVDEAQEWMNRARESLFGNPTMLNRIEFFLETAGFALVLGNTDLALSLIEDVERAVQGQELILYDVGVFERYRAFRAAHREHRTRQRSVRIGRRIAVAIERPTERNRLALLRCDHHFAPRNFG